MRHIVIITSRVNTASENIKKNLLRQLEWTEEGIFEEKPILITTPKQSKGNELKNKYSVVSTKERVLHVEGVAEYFKEKPPDLYVVASTHKSSSNQKTLSAHATGNFGSRAALGGKPNEVCQTSAAFITYALEELKETAPEGYETTMEVTHHGPSKMNAPLCFIEIGSTETEWNDEEAGAVTARALIAACERETQNASDKTLHTTRPSVVAFGGPHYAPNFMRVQENYLIGHICRKEEIEELTEEVVMQAFGGTVPKPACALLDWKGMNGAARQHLIALLEKLGIPYEKIGKK